jgi:hypothetical protein
MMQLQRVLETVESTTVSQPWLAPQIPSPADSGHGAEDRQRSSAGTGANTSTKVRKSDIMTSAIEYIHRSEVQRRHMNEEIRQLQKQLRMYQKIVGGNGSQTLR